MQTVANKKTVWSESYEVMLEALSNVFATHNITLEEHQPHIKGERFLMQAVTAKSGKKFILVGSYNGIRSIIKITNDKNGIAEIEHERACRSVVNEIDFAGKPFATPEELFHLYTHSYVISIQKFIDQPCSFLERPLPEQFSFALDALKTQESAHATTHKHLRKVRSLFGIRNADAYIRLFAGFVESVEKQFSDPTVNARMREAFRLLQTEKNTIEQYCSFLTHTDFVPHNFRIVGETMYLLDYSALTFGNKYEGWARFLNFMTLYNQPLESALIQYVADNRTKEESTALTLMRTYRLGEILCYYIRALEHSEDDLLSLNTLRVHFWSDVLSYILKNERIPRAVVSAYTEKRDALRSEDEKERQKGLH